jgi:hypothetical protein
MNLSFVMITSSDGDHLWSRCKALAAVTTPGDEVLLCDTGQSENGAKILRRFEGEIGWGEEVDVQLAALPETRALPNWATLRSLAKHRATLVLPEGAQPTSDGVKALRAQLQQDTPDLLIINSARKLGATANSLPCSDFSRWPPTGVLEGTAARTAALQLLPEPARLIPLGDLSHDEYESAVMNADSIGFVPTTVLLMPSPPAQDPHPQIAALGTRLAALPQDNSPDILTSAMVQLDDMMTQLAPLHVETFLTASEAMAKTLPQQLWSSILAHDGPIGPLLDALRNGDISAARAQLALHFAIQDRARVTALTEEVGRLYADLNLALPDPDYLMDLFQRARRA